MTAEHAPRLRDHWWPRPGWHPGRIALTWHLTFEHATDLHRLVAEYQRALTDLPGLNLIPREWLHLTIQGVGYADEVPPADVQAVIRSIRSQLATVRPFILTFGRPVIFGEAIAIRPEPAEPVHRLRTAIRDGIAEALGPEAVPTSPEQAGSFRPHVSIAYSRVHADAAPYTAALAAVDPEPARVPVTTVNLIRLDRQLDPQWLYRWTLEATAPLSS